MYFRFFITTFLFFIVEQKWGYQRIQQIIFYENLCKYHVIKELHTPHGPVGLVRMQSTLEQAGVRNSFMAYYASPLYLPLFYPTSSDRARRTKENGVYILLPTLLHAAQARWSRYIPPCRHGLILNYIYLILLIIWFRVWIFK